MTLVLGPNGKIGTRNGKLLTIGAGGSDCCCVGCCEGILIESHSEAIPPTIGSILLAELIGDTTGCFDVGATMLMSDQVSNTIWTSNYAGDPYFFANPGWKPLMLSCGNDGNGNPKLSLQWIQGLFCPSVDTSPPGSTYVWNQTSASCSPFEFIFSYEIDEVDPLGIEPGCNCAGGNVIPGTVQGVVTVRITIT